MDISTLSNKIDYVALSLIKNVLTGMIKIIIGILTRSVLVFANACYNLILCGVKLLTISGRNIPETSWLKKLLPVQKKNSGVLIGLTIVLLGVTFLIASLHTFITKEIPYYHWVNTYLITICTFSKLGISSIGLINRKNKNISFIHAKITNLVDGILSLNLTQEAILSMKNIENGWYYNGIFGIALSALVCIIGLILILYETL